MSSRSDMRGIAVVVAHPRLLRGRMSLVKLTTTCSPRYGSASPSLSRVKGWASWPGLSRRATAFADLVDTFGRGQPQHCARQKQRHCWRWKETGMLNRHRCENRESEIQYRRDEAHKEDWLGTDQRTKLRVACPVAQGCQNCATHSPSNKKITIYRDEPLRMTVAAVRCGEQARSPP